MQLKDKSKHTFYKMKVVEMKISPSILSANYAHLQKDISSVSNADYLHFDVMDGHYVDNITIGPLVLKDISQKTKLVKDVHLMIENPEKYVKVFSDAGADIITFHVETAKDPKKLIKTIKGFGKKAGIAINVDTPSSKIMKFLPLVDHVIVMTVRAGFGGQDIIPACLKKVSEIREHYSGDIEVDGGVNDKTILLAANAGANVFVSGSYIFSSKNPKEQVKKLKTLLSK